MSDANRRSKAERKKIFKICLFLLSSVIAHSYAFGGIKDVDQDQFEYKRFYQPGESFQYLLETQVIRNGQPATLSIAKSQHYVAKDSGVFIENVSWTSNFENGTDLSKTAQAFPSYQISLDDNGSLLLPDFEDDLMVGPVTDLNTFYVALSSKIGTNNLNHAGQNYVHSELIKGDWSDGRTNKLGKDCTQVILELVELTKMEAIIRAQFSPPSIPCLDFIQPWMVTNNENSVINNFQMIKIDSNSKKENVFWGTEHFEIAAVVERKTGLILEAKMTNHLDLTMKYNCDGQQQNCMAEMPMLIEREIKLTLFERNGLNVLKKLRKP